MLRGRAFGVVLVILFVAMAVELVLLVRQNRQLKAALSQVQAQEEPRGGQDVVPALRVGEVLGPLELPALSGGRTQIAYDATGPETVLLIFSPDCPACQANMDSWKQLVTAHRADARRRFVYVSTAGESETREYAEAHGLVEPVLVADRESMIGYKITHIPTTLVVRPGGVVRKVWVGRLPEEARTDFDHWAEGS